MTSFSLGASGATVLLIMSYVPSPAHGWNRGVLRRGCNLWRPCKTTPPALPRGTSAHYHCQSRPLPLPAQPGQPLGSLSLHLPSNLSNSLPLPPLPSLLHHLSTQTTRHTNSHKDRRELGFVFEFTLAAVEVAPCCTSSTLLPPRPPYSITHPPSWRGNPRPSRSRLWPSTSRTPSAASTRPRRRRLSWCALALTPTLLQEC